MQESYKKFKAEIQKINFSHIQQAFAELGQDNIPQLQLFQPQIELQHKLKSYKNVPSLNRGQPFENPQNFYLKMINIFKDFVKSQGKSFKLYWLQFEDISQISFILSKLYSFLPKHSEIQLVFFLIWCQNRSYMKIFLKLRQQILAKCTLDKFKNNPISVHNPSKYFKHEVVNIETVKVNYELWSFLAECAKVHIEEEMCWWCSNGDKQLQAIQLVIICFWAFRTQQETQSKNSPTKK